MTQQPSRIVQENVDALIERERAGRIEHGDDMDRTDFPVEAWLAELISESLDSANYGRKLMHMLPKLLAAADLAGKIGYTWTDASWQALKPSLPSEEVNALPEHVRKYIMWLETNADPGHTLQDNFRLTEENAGLRDLIAERAAPAFQVPAGWSRVRTEPTAEMLDAGINEIDYDGNEVTDNVRNVWLAMIEAARKDSPKGDEPRTPIDGCTESNCPRCRTHPDHRGDMEHAGIGRRPPQDSPKGGSDEVLWAVNRWNAEVSNRPLANIHRRSLDDAWRQVIRHFGGDDVTLCGPRHDDLLAEMQAQAGDAEVRP